jgi:predicted double-glycine peptidase
LYLPEKKGIPLASMRRYLEDAGFRAYTLRGEWADLEQHLAKGRPIIVTLKPRRGARTHFAVIAGIEGEHVWVNDPTRKSVHRVRQKDFRRQWGMAERWILLATPGAGN